MGKIKKILAVALTIAISASSAVYLNIQANEEFDNSGLKPGEVTQQKTAEWVDYANGIAKISFDVIGVNAEEPVDIAFIYDNSGSMQTSVDSTYQTSRWKYASEASLNFAKSFLENQDNKLAFIPFSDVLIDGKTVHTNPSDYFETHELLYDKNGNPDISVMRAIHIYYGMVEAGVMTNEELYEFCETSLGVTKDMLIERDGVDNALVPLTNDLTSIENAITSLYPSNVGTTNYEIALSKAKEYMQASTAKQKFIVMISDGRPDQGKEGIKIANQIKDAGITIYTLGAGISDNEAAWLKNIASKKDGTSLYFGSTPENLQNVLNVIRKNLNVAAHDAFIVDEINTDYFEYYEDENYKPTVNGTLTNDLVVNEDNSTVKWNIGVISNNKKTLTFYVKAKEQILNDELLAQDKSILNNAGLYPTNKHANLSYTTVNTQEQVTTGHEMESPKLEVQTATLETQSLVSDIHGTILDEDHALQYSINDKKAFGIPYPITNDSIIEKDGNIYHLYKDDTNQPDVVFDKNNAHQKVISRYIKQLYVTFHTNQNGTFVENPDIENTKSEVALYEQTISQSPDINANSSKIVFTGWNTKPDGTGIAFDEQSLINKDLDVYAQYSYLPVNVIFKDADGTIYSDTNITYNSSAIAPQDPVKPGYTFMGWDKSYQNVKEDLIITALWSLNTNPIIPAPEQPVSGDDNNNTPTTPILRIQQPENVLTPTPDNNTNEVTQDNTQKQNTTEEIKDDETPLSSGKEDRSWALINLLAAIGSIIITILLLLKRTKQEDTDEVIEITKRYKSIKIISTIISVISIITFFLTENILLPIAFIDNWTILMLVFLVIQIVLYIFKQKTTKEDQKVIIEE